MRLLPAGHVTSRIAGAVKALLASKRSTGEWSRDSVDALRHLVRARQAALLVSTGDQQRVFGDRRPSALLRQIPADADLRDERASDAATEWRGRADRAARPAADDAPGGRARYDMVGLLSPFGEAPGMVGVCCTFTPAISERTAMVRLSLLHAVQPALEAAVRDRPTRYASRDALRALLSALDEGAALYAGDGTMLDVNDALAEIVAADGAGELLREHMARAALTTTGPIPHATGGTIIARTPRHQYHLRTRLVADPDAGGRSLVLVIVEPVAPPTSGAVVLADAELLRERFRLTDREYDVVRLLHLGQSNLDIADALGISPNTARHHTERVMMKLGIRSRAAIHRALLESQQELSVHPGLADGPPTPADVPLLPRPRDGAAASRYRMGESVHDITLLHPAD